MIYVTVGTHEQPFDRLIECVDTLKEKGIIEEEVIIQSGFSKYEIKHCMHKSLFDKNDMLMNYEAARFIIMHGGPSSIIQSLQEGKVPVVVPRQKKFGEHVNDHQLDFCRAVSKRYNNIIMVEDISELKEAIIHYDELTASRQKSCFGNNEKFIKAFEQIVEEL
ncbi:MAG: multidrug MFS transporter [Lachnospiraceae bacterium]|nr:multidrug MFS transporter [Lachnospiraceae bacterium]